eukprot:1410007-Prymnesium_polylepis.2
MQHWDIMLGKRKRDGSMVQGARPPEPSATREQAPARGQHGQRRAAATAADAVFKAAAAAQAEPATPRVAAAARGSGPLRPSQIKVGSAVRVKWMADKQVPLADAALRGKFFPARVLRRHADLTFDVECESSAHSPHQQPRSAAQQPHSGRTAPHSGRTAVASMARTARCTRAERRTFERIAHRAP